MAASFVRGGDVYVSVGFAADYPDECLVTLSAPGMHIAMQFIENRSSYNGDGYQTSGGELDPNSLDPSLTNWNADVVSDGTISLK